MSCYTKDKGCEMIKLWGVFAGILLYLETIYHLGGFGLTPINPLFTIALILIVSALETLAVGSVRKKWKNRLFWIFSSILLVLYGAQLVYLRIFKQPLMWEAAVRGGQDALTNYWREALDGILKALPFLLLFSLPLIAVGFYRYWNGWKLPKLHMIEKLRCLFGAGIGLILACMIILIGKYVEADYYEDYHEFFDPLTVAENMGVLTFVQRDTAMSVGNLFSGLWERAGGKAKNTSQEEKDGPQTPGDDGLANVTPTDETGEAGTGQPEEPAEKVVDTSPNALPIDFEKLKAEADSKETTWLAEYMEGLTPTNRNKYTGIFEGYNLIYLSAEGFSPYAVREDLTPTLYRLVHSGFVFNNYYVPLWQTSTSDGEYINCTGLIPDGQFSMRKSSENDMAYTLPRYFEKDGVNSLAYHNNSLSYYDRHLTHINLGYDFKAAKLGELEEAEWGDKIFPMEHPDQWPASDLEMMQGTIPDYINQDRFHVYYMTVSGHMNYNFKGNAMSGKNKAVVSNLDMSENAQAYIACHVELDKALEYLLEQLEAAGKLDNTVIVMSADHYPYGMTQEEYEELAGKPLADNMDLYRNNLILWNAQMEESTVEVDKVCGSMDIIPTLLNLFGFEYDSRLYAGRDIFSDQEGLVIFNDRSFVSDTVYYSRKAKTTVWKEDLPEGERVPAGPVYEPVEPGTAESQGATDGGTETESTDGSSGGSTAGADAGTEAGGVAGIAVGTGAGAGGVAEAAVGTGAGTAVRIGTAVGAGVLTGTAAGDTAGAGTAGSGTGGKKPAVTPVIVATVEGCPHSVGTEEAREQYMTDIKQEVKQRYQFSAFILQKNYYKNIKETMAAGQ